MSDLIERLKAELAAVQDNRWGAAPVSITQHEAREIIAALLERDGGRIAGHGLLVARLRELDRLASWEQLVIDDAIKALGGDHE